MTLLNDSIQKQLRETFQELINPVTLVLFTRAEGSAEECGMCDDTRQLIEEVAALSEKIHLEAREFATDATAVQQYHVDKVPAIVVLGGPDNKDYGIRFYGIPSGYEFGALIEDILLASIGTPELSEITLQELAKLDQPVHIQVFTTPT